MFPLMHLTPGVVYIARTLLSALARLVPVYTLIHIVGARYISPPGWFMPCVYISSTILVFVLPPLLTDIREKWEAVARGAVLPRQAHYSYVQSLGQSVSSRFLGMSSN